jgi:hypothetical protein
MEKTVTTVENEVEAIKPTSVQPYTPQPPSTMIELALTSGADLDKIEKLIELQERWERNEAKKAYHLAMSAFKANPPEILKAVHVSFKSKKTGQLTEYDHPDLADVAEKVSKAMSTHGLHASWSTAQHEGGQIEVTCTITHVLGHSESTSLKASADQSGGKNNIQALGSTISYLERYTLLAKTGLAAKGIDDDGAASEPTGITEEQVLTIESQMAEVNADEKAFLKYLGVKGLDELDAIGYKKAIQALNDKAKKAGAK